MIRLWDDRILHFTWIYYCSDRKIKMKIGFRWIIAGPCGLIGSQCLLAYMGFGTVISRIVRKKRLKGKLSVTYSMYKSVSMCLVMRSTGHTLTIWLPCIGLCYIIYGADWIYLACSHYMVLLSTVVYVGSGVHSAGSISSRRKYHTI